MISIAALLFVTFSGSMAQSPSEFKQLTTPNSIALECSFSSPEGDGRLRIDSLNHVHLLLAEKSGTRECTLQTIMVKRDRQSFARPVELTLDFADCGPHTREMKRDTYRSRIELIREGKTFNLYLWAQARPVNCKPSSTTGKRSTISWFEYRNFNTDQTENRHHLRSC